MGTEQSDYGPSTDRPVDKEVYGIEAHGATTHEIKGEVSITRVENLDARWRVDDIHGGRVHLAGLHDGPYVESLVSLDPEAARTLGRVLMNAANYAEDQEGPDAE